MKKLVSVSVCLAVLMWLIAPSVMAKPVIDKQQIEQLVRHSSRIAGQKVKILPIRFADGWASVSYLDIVRDSRGNESPVENPADDSAPMLLKKNNGKWRIVLSSYIAGLSPRECQKIGLSSATARGLGIAIFQFASVVEQKEIERVVLKLTKDSSKAVLDQAKIADGFSSVSFKSGGDNGDETSVLKKSSGTWHKVYGTSMGAISIKVCRKIGITANTARRLGLMIGER